MRFDRLPMEQRPTPPAPRTDDRRAALAGVAVWVVALVVVLLDRPSLVADDRAWWVWCCVAGIVLGLAGLVHLQRREIKRRTALRRRQREERPGAAVPARRTDAAPAPAPAPTAALPVVAPAAGAPAGDVRRTGEGPGRAQGGVAAAGGDER